MSKELMRYILVEARARIARGWTKHNSVDAMGNVCAAQAIGIAGQRLFETHGYGTQTADAQSKVTHLVLLLANEQCRVGTWYASIPSWNDSCYTRREDVLAVFDTAIAMCAPPPPPRPKMVITYTDHVAEPTAYLPPQVKELVGV